MAPNRAAAYLHPTDVRDSRAIWVNPAGLALVREASVDLDLTVGDPGARGRLEQLTLGFNSRGLSFGYQRDVFDGGLRGHTYRIGLAGASGGLALGVAAAVYRGATSGVGWDAGVVYDPRPAVRLGVVLTNIGQPEVRGSKQRFALVPGVTLWPLGQRAALSSNARLTTDSVIGYAFGVAWHFNTRVPVGLFARLDTDGGLRRGAFAFGLSIGAANVVGLVASTPGDVRRLETLNLYGVASTPLAREPRL